MEATIRKPCTKSDHVRERILHQITIGNFSRGTVLPPERELAASFGVSYMTVRKAIGQLVDERYLERVPGVGTFVQNNISETKVQKQLGVIVPAWSAPEFSDLIMHVTEAAEKENYILKLIFARSWDNRSISDAWQSCDALICLDVAPLASMADSLREKFLSRTKPIVFIGPSAYHFGFDTVMGSPELEASLVLDKLIEAGHRRIAFVDQYNLVDGERVLPYPTFHSIWRERVAQLVAPETLESLDLSVETPRFQLPLKAIYDKLLRIGPKPDFTAITCDFTFAWGIVAAFNDLGIRIPEDVSIVTIGDRQEIPFYRPAFSYLRVSLRDHVFKALEVIRAREKNPDLPVQYAMIPPAFVKGETLKRITE